MKRPNQDVAGRPRIRDARLDSLGPFAGRRATDNVSYCRGLHDPMSTAAGEAALIDDFADFLADGEARDAELLPTADPAFEERLRRRLWRKFLASHLRDSGNEIH